MWEETRARRVKQSQQTRLQSRKRRQIRLVSHKEIEVNLPKEGKEKGILKREGGERGGGEDQDIFRMDKRAKHVDGEEVRIGEGKETLEEVMEGNLTAGMVIGSQGGEDGIEGKGGGGVMTEATTTILTTGIGILDRDGGRELDGVQDQVGVRIGTHITDLLLRQVNGEAENSRMTGICHCMGGRAEDCNAGENLFTFVKKNTLFFLLSVEVCHRGTWWNTQHQGRTSTPSGDHTLPTDRTLHCRSFLRILTLTTILNVLSICTTLPIIILLLTYLPTSQTHNTTQIPTSKTSLFLSPYHLPALKASALPQP